MGLVAETYRTNVGAVKHSALPMLHLRPDTAGPQWTCLDTPWLKLPNTYVDLPEGYSQRTQMGVDVCLSNNGPRIPLVQDFSSSRGVEWTPLVLPGTRLLRKGVVITLCPARAAVTFRRGVSRAVYVTHRPERRRAETRSTSAR